MGFKLYAVLETKIITLCDTQEYDILKWGRIKGDLIEMAESKEELKSLLMKVKEESEKVDLKLNIK